MRIWRFASCGMIVWTLTFRAHAATVDVHLVDGSTVAGELVECSVDRLVVQRGKERVAVEVTKLLDVTMQGKEAATKAPPAIWVALRDGTQFPASDFAADGKSMTATHGNASLKSAVRDVSWVRLTAESAAVKARWGELAAARSGGDRVVLKKGDANLDVLEGTVRDVSGEIVQFELDGEVLRIKRPRVYGIFYYQSAARRQTSSAAVAIGRDGSRWSLERFAIAGDELRFTTFGGLSVGLPLASLSKLDFSAGKLAWLSDLEMETVEWTPLVGTGRETPELAKLHQPRRDRSLSGGPLTLARRDEDGRRVTTRYEKGLAMHSRTKITYRLPAEFRTLSAWAGIDPTLRDGGNVRLVFSGDDKPLASYSISSRDDPSRVELDLRGIRRLTVLVDFGDDLDLGDFLHLVDARLLK